MRAGVSELTAVQLDGTDPVNIVRVSRLLRDGGLAVIPTDTVYGLTASVFRPEAITRLFAAKQRPAEKQVPILLATAADLPIVVNDVPRQAWALITRFWPGPLTLVLPTGPLLANTLGRSGTIGVRVPGGRVCLQLLETVGEPLIGTSANVSGRPAARTGDEAFDDLGDLVDAVLVDDSTVGSAPASTVAEITNTGDVSIHRLGPISAEQIQSVVHVRVTIKDRA